MHYLLQKQNKQINKQTSWLPPPPHLYIGYWLTGDTVELVYWWLAADLHHIPAGAD